MFNRLGKALTKPEYLFRPSQALRRLFAPNRSFPAVVTLPWGLAINIDSRDAIGHAILHLGLYDLPVTETIFRLLDAGDVAVDAGANIGQMTSIMAFKTGSRGRVLSFEPHPEIFSELEKNVALWNVAGVAATSAHRCALSNHAGEATLNIPPGFRVNRGLASLAPTSESVSSFSVRVDRLDAFIEQAGLLKIDVEGHELRVLEGCDSLLKDQRIRDIIFEDHSPYPSEVDLYLESSGYTLFDIGSNLFGPRITPAGVGALNRHWEPQSRIATADPRRTLDRLGKPGWHVLKRRKP